MFSFAARTLGACIQRNQMHSAVAAIQDAVKDEFIVDDMRTITSFDVLCVLQIMLLVLGLHAMTAVDRQLDS